MDKKKPKASVTKPKKQKKPYEVKGKSGNTEITKKTKQTAQKKQGVFKERPGYKGRVNKNKSGKVGSVRLHSGEVIQTTGPVSRRAAMKKYAKDQALHSQDKKKQSQRINRFANAPLKKKKN